MLPVFKGQNVTAMWVHESDPHPKEKGHELIAAGLFDFIVSKKLLQPNERPTRSKDP
jgi:hypothetical protein